MAALLLFALLLGSAHAAQPAPGAADACGAVAEHIAAPGAAAPAWLPADRAIAQQALLLLNDAPAHGLDPRRYGAEALQQRHTSADGESAPIEREIGAAMIRYLCDLHRGRVAAAEREYHAVDSGFDPAGRLAKVRDPQSLIVAVEAAAPAMPIYARVKAALARYRELFRSTPAWPRLPDAGRAGIQIGQAYAGSALLRARLRLLGDLEAGADTDADHADENLYTPALAAAVRRFQSRHGLAEDGVLGATTLAALNLPLSDRVAQLALTLERLRWLPAPPAHGRVIAVNVPTYQLWAFDARDGYTTAALEMRVIVGTGGRTPTPLFVGQMRYLEFDPYWNVPASIQAGEIVPKLARNPAYLAQNDMELVGGDGRVLRLSAQDALARLRAGTARVRQRPGPANVLGDVKFAMPNPMNIYLHSTSARELFKRTRRDLSHGCIRVEQTAALAEFVLADAQQWSREAVSAAMAAGKNRTVTLAQPVPVVLFYATALVDDKERVLFAQDIYRRDRPLIDALGLE